MCLPRAQGIKSTEKLHGAGRGQALLASGHKIYLFQVVLPQFLTVLEAAMYDKLACAILPHWRELGVESGSGSRGNS